MLSPPSGSLYLSIFGRFFGCLLRYKRVFSHIFLLVGASLLLGEGLRLQAFAILVYV